MDLNVPWKLIFVAVKKIYIVHRNVRNMNFNSDVPWKLNLHLKKLEERLSTNRCEN
jgi:hypothetical protein